MKNIVTITLAILFLLLVGFLVSNYFSGGSTSKLGAYLPQTITTSSNLTLFEYSEQNEPYAIKLGASQAEEEEFTVTSAQGHYSNEMNKFALTVSVESVDPKRFESYKEKAWQRYQAPSRGGTSTQISIKNHDVYISFRTLSETDDTSKMVIMGGGYIFYPENNVIVTFSMLNPRLHSCENVWSPETCFFDEDIALPTIDDARIIAEKILSLEI
jgi:hypothetical protein